ncbi:DUF3883 domain-containing protein [Acrocarpospora phusangensis]|uniref:DUF3883 domain-containing protein n=1 Tax=Acrocarpospora phusangensis TaxID=1070424 RepID=UPI00194E756D
MAVLRSGLIADQIQYLLSVSRYENGALYFGVPEARRGSAQLLGLVSWLPEYATGSPAHVYGQLCEELTSAWNLRSAAVVSVGDERQRVGERAELYSLQLQRQNYLSIGAQIAWVSQEAPNLGYDIEIRSPRPIKCIEVKGSRAPSLSFILSDNEWQAALRLQDVYEINFWGDVRLDESAPQGYARLTGLGFPIVIENPATVLTRSPYVIQPQGWKVRLE